MEERVQCPAIYYWLQGIFSMNKSEKEQKIQEIRKKFINISPNKHPRPKDKDFRVKDENTKKIKMWRPFSNERICRLWAASEAKQIGRGGISIVAEAIRMSPTTIRRGIREMEQQQTGQVEISSVRSRCPGGGRKKKSIPSS
jgi:hypothetical protein